MHLHLQAEMVFSKRKQKKKKISKPKWLVPVIAIWLCIQLNRNEYISMRPLIRDQIYSRICLRLSSNAPTYTFDISVSCMHSSLILVLYSAYLKTGHFLTFFFSSFQFLKYQKENLLYIISFSFQINILVKKEIPAYQCSKSHFCL